MNTEELIAQGNSLKGEGKYDEAVKCFKQVLTDEPRSEKAWFFLADTYTWSRDYGRALACFEQVLALNSNDAAAKAKVQDMKPVVDGNSHYRSIYITEKRMFSAISRFNFNSTENTTEILTGAESIQSERIREMQQLLISHDWTSGIRAARALGSIGSPLAIKALAEGLEGDTHGALAENTFTVVVEELTRLDRELLVQKLGDMYRRLPYLHVKKSAIIRALGKLGGSQALSIVHEALSDKDATVVMYAKQALGVSEQKLESATKTMMPDTKTNKKWWEFWK